MIHAIILGVLLFTAAINGNEPNYVQQAQELEQAGRYPEAIAAYQQALTLHPDDFVAHFLLGNCLYYRKSFQDALQHYQKAYECSPTNPQVNYNIGIVYETIDDQEQAQKFFQQAIVHDPRHTRARLHLIKLLRHAKKDAQALVHLQEIITYDQSCKDAYVELSHIVRSQQFEQAIDYLKKAIALDKNDIGLNFDLGYLYINVGKTKEAIDAYNHVLRLSPNNISALYNIGYARKMEGSMDAAIETFKQVLSLRPDYDQAHFALGRAYLQKGDFETGWQLHTKHLRETGKNADQLRALLAQGSLAGKTVIMLPEGGLGDTIQFIRFGSMLKDLGAHVIAVVQGPLLKILSRCTCVDQLIKTNSSGLPAHDATVPLMTLPAVFNSNEQTIPRDIPYVYPDPTLVAYWKDYLKKDTNIKVGIVWQADVFNDSSRPPVARRGMPLKQMFPLAQFNHLSLYSLQKHDGVEELKDLPPYIHINLLPEDFDTTNGSFMDTAAIMSQLDLVITVDTATAHLAGALGVPVWLLLPYSIDWRWFIGRQDTPWYPNMRIFQQPRPFDWDAVMQAVTFELAKFLINKAQNA